jgi:hypothetical protein
MSMDDTIRTGKQAEEDLLMALIEQGAVPMLTLTPETIKTGLPVMAGESLGFLRIRKDMAEGGCMAGAEIATLIKRLPPNAWGKVALTFDGWADDPRELFEVPEVIDFCRGLLLGPPPVPDLVNAREVLAILVDDAPWFLGLKGEEMTPAGGIWLISAAFPDQCYAWSDGRHLLNFSFALGVRSQFLDPNFTIPTDPGGDAD